MPSDSVKPYRRCGYCQTWNTRPCGEQCAWSPADPTLDQQALPNGALLAVTELNTVVAKLVKGELTTEDYAQARERLIAVCGGEAQEARGYLSRLLANYAPQCSPLHTLMGVVTQIDNLLIGSIHQPIPDMAGTQPRPECDHRKVKPYIAHRCVDCGASDLL